ALVDELLAEPDERLDLGAPLLAYRGSYLQLMQELAPLTDGVDPKPLIVHVPGVNQDGIKDTPLLELNESGYQYRKALTTLIHEAAAGRVTADEVDEFLRAHEEDGAEALTLEAADAWMDERMAMADDTARLVLRGFEPAALIQALNENRAVVRELGEHSGSALDHYFGARLGLPTAWPSAERRAWVRTQTARYADLAAQWAMSVEYVHDLDRSRGRKRALKAPVLNAAEELASPLVAACRETAERLRASARDFYTGVADDFEDRLEDERDEGKPEELGRIDTFRFEEDRLLQAALRAVREQRWSQAAEWAQQRLDGKSVWLSVDPNRRKAWRLISTAASLGQAIEASPLSFADTQSLAEATQRYAEIGAPIDGLHRELEQQAASALVDLPHTKLVRGALGTARARWRQWAEAGAQDWSTLCERAGALPSPDMQQRTVFVEVVKPMLDEDDKVALFLVDAMRYEMAQQLIELIGQHAATSVHLAPRLAELPTITAVGMNALAHVGAGASATGRLRPKLDKKRRRFQGFETDGITLNTRASREKSYKRAARGVKWIPRSELGDDPGSLKTKITHAQLVVVHSEAIDKAGENGHGPLVFAQELRELHKAWELLRAADVRRFVITSDHGFLLRRPGDHGDVLDFGKTYDATARHALYPSPTVDELRLALTLRSLGYEGADEALILPRGLDVFEVAKDRDFVHGGNSPQERVIPVLTIRHKHLAG
ncbi:MAG: BREX-6 system phosphatase PglZ, partial [Myxococcales bacterium]|nr:BREX-6 system phosphatase PglZ [Myxococcales bacterium]